AYAYVIDTLTYALGREDRSALAGLESGYGDDYTYATLFVALARAALVPSRPVGGLLVTDDGHAYSHFWAEFFVTGIGWVPVDPSLGDGAFPAAFPVPEAPRAFYFANLDNARVAFHHGFDVTEPTFLDGVRVSPEDPHTLQRSYAEGGIDVDSFRLAWHTPRVIGRYESD
ncbi:MAG: transglutaminase-like domain-containing protein, partial [Spirochaetota bacterium]